MNWLVPLIWFSFLNNSTFALSSVDLQTGDVLLQSLPCSLCALIEAEEGSLYSHVGVMGPLFPGPQVFQAHGRVHRTSLGLFLRQTRPGSRVRILRPVFVPETPLDLNDRFARHFEGLSYDASFLWGNRDEKGEKIYCSELVVKLLEPVLERPVRTKPMHFVADREAWVHHFKGYPPDGEPGVSPEDLIRSGAFIDLGDLD
jgi:hypothetical protein